MHTYMKKNERKRRAMMRLMTAFTAFAIAISIFIVSGSHMHSHEVQASSVEHYETVYQSIRVNAGDTLWSIADTYGNVSELDRQSYIKEIKRINHMTEQELQAGSYIIIPAYVNAEEM